METKKHIFIIGCKGIPAQYGGYETFVENLTYYNRNPEIKYHVACIGEDENEFEHNNARCFEVKIPNIGPAKAIIYDLKALRKAIKYIKDNNLKNATIYILACRIGPFLRHYKKMMKKIGVLLYINPDGHEWLRAKWSMPIKKYWKLSEKLMVKHADLVICDSNNIERYIKKEYSKYKPQTTFIAYGADIEKSTLKDNDDELTSWYGKNDIKAKQYYLIVGRFVPENNLETIIKEFIKSKTKKDLVIITNIERNKFYEKLKKETCFEKDKRIKFVGTVYEKELLKKIRENAFAYIHGHSVGGTNPSLIEALATTDLNLLYDVGFNREVAEETTKYWQLSDGNLSSLINSVDNLKENIVKEIGEKAKKRVLENYRWDLIVDKYERVFRKEN